MATKFNGLWWCSHCNKEVGGPFEHGNARSCPNWKLTPSKVFGWALKDIPSSVARLLQRDKMDMQVNTFDQAVQDYGDGKWAGN